MSVQFDPHLSAPSLAAREGPSPAQWQAVKDDIRHLYKTSPLKEVRRVMESKYDFRATERMYKSRLSQWGFSQSGGSMSRAVSKESTTSMSSSCDESGHSTVSRQSAGSSVGSQLSVGSQRSLDSGYYSMGSSSHSPTMSTYPSLDEKFGNSIDSGYDATGDFGDVTARMWSAQPNQSLEDPKPLLESSYSRSPFAAANYLGTTYPSSIWPQPPPAGLPWSQSHLAELPNDEHMYVPFDNLFETNGMLLGSHTQDYAVCEQLCASYNPFAPGFGIQDLSSEAVSTFNWPLFETSQLYATPDLDLHTCDSGYSSAMFSTPSSLLADRTPPTGNSGAAEYDIRIPTLILNNPQRSTYEEYSNVTTACPQSIIEPPSPIHAQSIQRANSPTKSRNRSGKKISRRDVTGCERSFIRKPSCETRLKSSHPEPSVHASIHTSDLKFVHSHIEQEPTVLAGVSEPIASKSRKNLSTPVLQQDGGLKASSELSSSEQKDQTVNSWLEHIQTNGEATPNASKPEVECGGSRKSHRSISTPRASPLASSYSELSDSLWLESDGEASFVYGEDVMNVATPKETLSACMSANGVAQELVTQYLTQAKAPSDGAEISSQESSASSTSGHTTTNTTTITTPPSSNPKTSLKRSLMDDNDGEGSRRRKNTKPSDAIEQGTDQKLLACPYTKFDPRRYSERNELEKNYRGCSSCFLRDNARLKQHLYRVHRRPDHYCPICFAFFNSGVALNAHIVERSCEEQPSPFEEMMTSDQLAAVKRRGLGKSRSEGWFDIYKTLFPDAPLPLDPYVDSSHAETVQDFLSFVERQGPQILSVEMNQRLFGTSPASLEEREWVDRVMAESINVLLQRLESRFRRDGSSES